ncbi:MULTISPECIES: S8 family serine peptidase [Actinosynnema]|uniref:S8 family serine peptidase n=1 Tax=Actinosynnema TaxID=40566 RepID=UPI0020A531C7|nr:S8 family serine peptidase [Actinosynnema pretiosum]MCP2095491.1 Subtilase family protein [Actinosynnema pretiosum]
MGAPARTSHDDDGELIDVTGRRRGTAALAVAALLAGGAAGPVATAETAAAQGEGTAPTEVVLLTGDRVALVDGRLAGITPGAGRERIAFHSSTSGGRVRVVPGDAAAALASGKLDPRLFDVTALAARPRTGGGIPLLITKNGSDGPRATSLSSTRELPDAHAVAARAPESGAAFPELLVDPTVRKVWLDAALKPALDRSTAQIGAPQAWQAGLTGAGVTVAVLDTGIDGDHPDLRGKEVAQANFSEEPDNADNTGHGTHVAATIASGDARYRGVAPDAELLDAKVCDVETCLESWIIAGMRWAVDQGADVLNLSLAFFVDEQGESPLEDTIDSLSASSGALFVVAAGNNGHAPGTPGVGGSVNTPGTADAALTVGAVERDESLAGFSSRGPRRGDGGVKPDLTAPGVDIVAARAGSTGRVAKSGTSMATPHVVGAAALLKQRHPDWSGQRIKAALMASARPNPALYPLEQGAGRVDVPRALAQTVTAEPATLALGVQRWPHEDDEPVTKDLVYRNDSASPITLDLTVEQHAPDGTPVTGVFTASPAALTVPAGGTATTRITATTRADTGIGVHSGTVVASGGPTAVRTPVSVDRAEERHDLTIRHLGPDGGPSAGSWTFVSRIDGYREDRLGGGEGTISLPPGAYALSSLVRHEGGSAVFSTPLLELDGDTTLVLDAREAAPLVITPPEAGTRPGPASITSEGFHEGRPSVTGTFYPAGFPEGLRIGRLEPDGPLDEQITWINARFQGASAGYRFGWLLAGGYPTGFTRAPARSELATIRTAIGPVPAGARASLRGGVPAPDGHADHLGALDVPAPGSLVELVTTGAPWTWAFTQDGPGDFYAARSSGPETYLAGRTYRRAVNTPVFAPSARPGTSPLVLDGDRLRFEVALFGDGGGHTGYYEATESARTSLRRNGELVGESDEPGRVGFAVPPGAADYRVDAEAVRAPEGSDFSTRTSGSWTFRSTGARGELPLTLVRPKPSLDPTGAARPGLFRVPLEFQRHGGASGPRAFTGEVSYDDGATWSPARASGSALLLEHPRGKRFASLRVTGSDDAGNTFTQTVVRAYKIKG